MPRNPVLKPILKWVGGKRQLPGRYPPVDSPVQYLCRAVRRRRCCAAELQPKKAIINDYNAELINVYVCVRDHLEELLEALEKHKELNSADHFYKVRALDREPGFKNLPPIERAARIIYLNKTCYNGLYRVNLAVSLTHPTVNTRTPRLSMSPSSEQCQHTLTAE